MDLYHITLYLHIVTLLVAAALTAVTKLAVGRRMRARTVGEVLDWHGVLMSSAKLFPICLVAFVVTGSYMVSVNSRGVVDWVRRRRTGRRRVAACQRDVSRRSRAKHSARCWRTWRRMGPTNPRPSSCRRRFVAALPMINTVIALAVAFDMVTKPVSIPVALGVVAIGIVIGAVLGMRRPAAAAAPSPSKASAAIDA